MDTWETWVWRTVIGLGIAALGYFLKRLLDGQQRENARIREDFTKEMDKMRVDFQAAISAQDKRVEKLETRLQDTLDAMPYKYVLRDDFIRAMSAVEVKLNKILDKLSGLGPQC